MNVVFDMDGLMFDTERIAVMAWDYAGERMGLGKAGYMVLKTLGTNAAKTAEIWRAEFGGRYREEELETYTAQFQEEYYANHRVPVKKGLYVLLEYIRERGGKMAVASSTPKEKVERYLRDAGVYGYFSGIVCGDMIQRSKPDPEIYTEACRKLGVEPKDTYALEDSRNGLLSAYRAGCKPVMVPDLWQPDEEILRIIVGKFDDLEQVKTAFAEGKIG